MTDERSSRQAEIGNIRAEREYKQQNAGESKGMASRPQVILFTIV